MISVVLGLLIAFLIDRPIARRGLVRVMLISPFFIMPTVNALLWKTMMMNPIYNLFAVVAQAVGAEPIDWMTHWPLLSIIIMVSWQWRSFAPIGLHDLAAKTGSRTKRGCHS